MNSLESGFNNLQAQNVWHTTIDLLPSPAEFMPRITPDQIRQMASLQTGVDVSQDGQNLHITSKKDDQGRFIEQVWLDDTGLVVKRTSVIWTFKNPSTGDARKSWENNFAYDDERRLIKNETAYINEEGEREVTEVTTWEYDAGEGNYTEQRKRGDTVDTKVFRNFEEDVSQRKTERISS